ncbi:MAG: enoyl-CoA hydratase/isomerase family protein [Sinomicrobium sp.]|nr:enoyl-CoA hydratase/isomerase family protein [Sinomicrobium sp.]
MNDFIQLKKENNIAVITLNRPQVFNSIDRPMAAAFRQQLSVCEADNDIRAIVLTGSGKAFCAGQDLQEVTDPERHPGFRQILSDYNAIILAIRNSEKPVIAAVNGVAAGAGANIALACDIVVVSEAASFIQAFSKIGLIPDSGGTFFLPRLVGFQKASALAMLGDKVSAREAEHMGMIYKCYDAGVFEDEVHALACKVAAMPTKGLGLIKKALNKALGNDLESQLELEFNLQIEASETEDYNEGVNAFIQKRNPVFKGK